MTNEKKVIHHQTGPEASPENQQSFENCKSMSMAERFVDQMRTVLESEARIALLKEKDELQQHMDWEREALKEERAKLEEAWRALDEKIEKFKYEKETFVNEKRKMKTLGALEKDIVELNVAGELFTVKRSTLCQVENSFFSSLFSGRWDDSIERDGKGRIFLDFQPYCFKRLLDCLRNLRIASPDRPVALRNMPFEYWSQFEDMLDYLGLRGAFYSEDEPESFLGKRVKIYWVKYQKYYSGTITAYSKHNNSHEVTYDDGDVRFYDLMKHEWKFDSHTYIHWIKEK